MTRAILVLALIGATAAAPSCLPLLSPGTLFGSQYGSPAGNQTLSNITDSLYTKLLEKGGKLAQIGLPWADIETIPGQPNTQLVADILQGAHAKGLVILFDLAAIDTEHASVPPDLVDPKDPTRLRPGLNWTSQEVVSRYASMMIVVAPIAAYYGAVYIGVGNEVSVNLGLHPETGVEFAGFVYTMRTFIKSITSESMAVGVTVTVGDLAAMAGSGGGVEAGKSVARVPVLPSIRTSSTSSTTSSSSSLSTSPYTAVPLWLQYLFDATDAMPLTFYALYANLSVISDAATVQSILSNAFSVLPPTACLIFQELGLPSGYDNASSTDGGTQQIQADFFTSTLQYLREVNSSGTGQSVRAVSAYQFLDMSAADCEGLGPYYNTTNPAFFEYLCTLGIVRGDGVPKLAYEAYLDAIVAA